MLFILKRTSESYVDGEDFALPEKFHYYLDTGIVFPNFIDFKTIEELIEFEKEVGTVIICRPNEYDIKDSGFKEPILEIYDSSRE